MPGRPSFRRLRPNREHNAGFLTFEAVVTYPFHPLAGRTVLVIGQHEHDGIRHFLIRQPNGGSYQIPDWMLDPAASHLAIVSVPRLPISQLVLLRALVDRLVTSPLKEGSTGRIGHDKVASETSRSVRCTNRADRIDRSRTPEGGSTFAGVADGSSNEAAPSAVGLRQKGDRQ